MDANTPRKPWAEHLAGNASDRFTRNAAGIVESLRDLANQVERDSKVRETFHGAPAHSWAAHQIQHSILWGLANLNLDGLTNVAAEADAAATDATDHAIVDGHKYAIINPQPRGDGSINACLAPVKPKEG